MWRRRRRWQRHNCIKVPSNADREGNHFSSLCASTEKMFISSVAMSHHMPSSQPVLLHITWCSSSGLTEVCYKIKCGKNLFEKERRENISPLFLFVFRRRRPFVVVVFLFWKQHIFDSVCLRTIAPSTFATASHNRRSSSKCNVCCMVKWRIAFANSIR